MVNGECLNQEFTIPHIYNNPMAPTETTHLGVFRTADLPADTVITSLPTYN